MAVPGLDPEQAYPFLSSCTIAKWGKVPLIPQQISPPGGDDCG
jgi:hypothetical protein